MGTRELIQLGAKITGLNVRVVSDGPRDRRPARSPAPDLIPAVYADIFGTEADIRAAYSAGHKAYLEGLYPDE